MSKLDKATLLAAQIDGLRELQAVLQKHSMDIVIGDYEDGALMAQFGKGVWYEIGTHLIWAESLQVAIDELNEELDNE